MSGGFAGGDPEEPGEEILPVPRIRSSWKRTSGGSSNLPRSSIQTTTVKTGSGSSFTKRRAGDEREELGYELGYELH